MWFARGEGSLVQSFVREEVIILQGADLKPKNKAFLLSQFECGSRGPAPRPRTDVNMKRRESARKFPSCRLLDGISMVLRLDIVSTHKFDSNSRSVVPELYGGTC